MHGDAGGLGSRVASNSAEESPGSTKQGWRVTPAGREGFGISVKGKCHREQTAKFPVRLQDWAGTARVKGCGKSAPGDWQQDPHGKPHPEQGRIGAARPRASEGWGVSPQVRGFGQRLRPPGLAARALRQRKAKRNGCRSAHVRKETARITEPGLQAPRQYNADVSFRPLFSHSAILEVLQKQTFGTGI